jgi:hypothetical protein
LCIAGVVLLVIVAKLKLVFSEGREGRVPYTMKVTDYADHRHDGRTPDDVSLSEDDNDDDDDVRAAKAKSKPALRSSSISINERVHEKKRKKKKKKKEIKSDRMNAEIRPDDEIHLSV